MMMMITLSCMCVCTCVCMHRQYRVDHSQTRYTHIMFGVCAAARATAADFNECDSTVFAVLDNFVSEVVAGTRRKTDHYRTCLQPGDEVTMRVDVDARTLHVHTTKSGWRWEMRDLDLTSKPVCAFVLLHNKDDSVTCINYTQQP